MGGCGFSQASAGVEEGEWLAGDDIARGIALESLPGTKILLPPATPYLLGLG